MPSHEDTGTASRGGALTTETLDLAVGADLVVLEDGHLDLLPLVLDLLGGGVVLLLPLLATTTKTEDKVESGLLLDVVVRKGAAILELLAGEDETLLVGGDTLLVLDLGLDVVDGVLGLDLEGDGLARKARVSDALVTIERATYVLTKICMVSLSVPVGSPRKAEREEIGWHEICRDFVGVLPNRRELKMTVAVCHVISASTPKGMWGMGEHGLCMHAKGVAGVNQTLTCMAASVCTDVSVLT